MKVLLLNPPASRPVFRDQYCSHTAKAGYYWPPVDLLLESGVLARDHDIRVLDAVIENRLRAGAMQRIREFAPEAILCLSSILTAEKDLELLKECKAALGCKVILAGDICYARPGLFLESPVVDAVCLQFPAAGLSAFLRGDPAPADMAVRKDGAVFLGPLSTGAISYPVPRHFDFPLERYANPLMKRAPPCALVMTALGCPHRCDYCASRIVPYRERPFEEVFAELDELKRHRVREIWVRDFTFNVKLDRAKEFCREMIRRDYRFSWYCSLRPDNPDPELLQLMARGGCHTALIGVESSNAALLSEAGRRIAADRVRHCFEECRRHGVRALAHLIIGFPGESRESIDESIRFVCSLPADYLSVNFFVPRSGSAYTPAYRTLEEVLAVGRQLDSALATGELGRFRKKALLRFYLRPSILWRHLFSGRSFIQLGRAFVMVLRSWRMVLFAEFSRRD